MPRSRKAKSQISRRTTAILLLVIIVLGAVAIFYSPLLDGLRPRSFSPAEIYANSNQAVVTIDTVTSQSEILGTGFVIFYGSAYYIITNFHMVDGYVTVTATFSDGDAYRAKVVGTDAYSDLAVVTVNSPTSEYHPLTLGSSSELKVGETVVAIGNPYGLSNTITVGIVSQTGRSIQTGMSGNFAIADVIQFSAPINPGNSGGPLINTRGLIVGITTASVTDAQGLGFAIPSDTITRELPSLLKTGGYDKHPYLGVALVDMSYDLSKAIGTNVTWGVLVENVLPDGPAGKAGLRGGTENVTFNQQTYLIGGDIITSLDGHRVTNYDSLSAYLEEHAVSGQTIQVGIIREGEGMVISITLGTRPSIQA